ncbi:unnamed protein product, partial [Arabidopsis halleri]
MTSKHFWSRMLTRALLVALTCLFLLVSCLLNMFHGP